MKSTMAHQFSKVPHAQIPRSSFNRSHGLKTTFDGGYLVPIYVDEALPGDTHTLKMTAFARLATPIHPIMDNMFMETFFFSVPIRLIWDNWQKFNGEQDNPGDSTDYIVPYMIMDSCEEDSFHDYMGIPPFAGNPTNINCLHHRAYNCIYNEWFRDQNLINSLTCETDDGPDNPNAYVLKRRGKRHDYFTSALPWPQKGDEVILPLGDQAPITGIGIAHGSTITGPQANIVETSGQVVEYTVTGEFSGGAGGASQGLMAMGSADGAIPEIYADLTNATSATINELRQAFQVQRLQERDARGGTRYTEIIRAHFGVTSPDARLQRPEFLGGGSSYVNINPVAQTSDPVDANSTPQGNLAAFGTATLNNHGFTASFTEHCVLLGLVNVRADLTYQQGLNRMFSRQTRFDFYWPALAQIGEQTILEKEIFLQGLAQDDEAVFGYQERYAEYRYKPSMITGKFRSKNTATLDPWHLSQYFIQAPLLNGAFIEDNPPIDRVIAVQDEPHFLFDAYFHLQSARPMPTYGVPGMIDHF